MDRLINKRAADERLMATDESLVTLLNGELGAVFLRNGLAKCRLIRIKFHTWMAPSWAVIGRYVGVELPSLFA